MPSHDMLTCYVVHRAQHVWGGAPEKRCAMGSATPGSSRTLTKRRSYGKRLASDGGRSEVRVRQRDQRCEYWGAPKALAKDAAMQCARGPRCRRRIPDEQAKTEGQERFRAMERRGDTWKEDRAKPPPGTDRIQLETIRGDQEERGQPTSIRTPFGEKEVREGQDLPESHEEEGGGGHGRSTSQAAKKSEPW